MSINKLGSITLRELQEHELYKLLVKVADGHLSELRTIKDPKALIKSKFATEIVHIYGILFRGSFNKTLLSTLEYSNFLLQLWPCLSAGALPLIANLEKKSQQTYQNVRASTVMTCVWAIVEEYSSGRDDYIDILSRITKGSQGSFDCLFYNAAQLLMLECWREDVCDHREFGDDRLTVLEQRALLRFFIICYQRIEIIEIRRCCMQLLSPCVWLHVPEPIREESIYKDNKLAKILFGRSISALKTRFKDVNLERFKNVKDAYTHCDNSKDTKTKSDEFDQLAKFILIRDFINSLMNQFVYILEDGLDLDVFSKEASHSVDSNSLDLPDITEGEGELPDSSAPRNANEVEAPLQGKSTYVMQRLMLCENHMEFVIDLLSQLHTRRIIKPLFDNKLILIRSKQALLYGHLEGSLFKGLVEILTFYLRFYINEELGTPMEYTDVLENYYRRFDHFQRICYLNFSSDDILSKFHLTSVYELNNVEQFKERLLKCKTGTLLQLLIHLGLISPNRAMGELLTPSPVELTPVQPKKKKAIKVFFVEVLLNYLERPKDSISVLNEMPLYPNEEILWSSSHIPEAHYVRLSSLALFKLNLQYLTLFDYLFRNFTLFKLESAFQIRLNIQDAVHHSAPKAIFDDQGRSFGDGSSLPTVTKFEESYRMVIEVDYVRIVNVCAANVLMTKLSYVEMDIVVDTSKVKDYQIRKEWQQLRRHDVIFLVSVNARLNKVEKRLDQYETSEEVPLNLGIDLVRGAEVIQLTDEEGHIISDLNPYETRVPIGFRICIKVHLDYNQYIQDIQKDPNLYTYMNLLVRRHARENNFKAVLSTLRNIINQPVKLPHWINDLFLGFGDPQKALYPELEGRETDIGSSSVHNYRITSTDEVTANNINKVKERASLQATGEDCIMGNGVFSGDTVSTEHRIPGIVVNYLNTWKTIRHFFENSHSFYYKLVRIGERDIEECLDLEISTSFTVNRGISKFSLGPKELLRELEDMKLKLGRKKGIRHLLADKDGYNYILQIGDSIETTLDDCTVRHPLREDLLIKPRLLVLIPKFKLDLEVPLSESSQKIPTDENSDTIDETKEARCNGNQDFHNLKTSISSSFYFTPRQVESIRSGVSDGLTMIVGPPGTGKTDVICQIVGILFKNNPTEKTVICTHSNYALNDIFTKLVINGHVDEHHIVRLGSAELEIDEFGDFSKWGRVNHILQRRLDLLSLVKQLTTTTGIIGDYDFNVQLALQLFESKILPILERGEDKKHNFSGHTDNTLCHSLPSAPSTLPKFSNTSRGGQSPDPSDTDLWEDQEDKNPSSDENTTNRPISFSDFFKLDLEPLETLRDLMVDWHEIRQNMQEHALKRMFLFKFYKALKELLPFEVLRNNSDRSKYLVEKYVRLVGMTCTHAAIAKEMFRYDNLVMEEAGQVLDVETFVPLSQPLRRVILSGDYLQLPPIVQNRSLERFSNLHQSLFTRFVRLGTPFVMLDKQGRSRPEIADLYTHFYPIKIENLESLCEYKKVNPGFQHVCQFINVKDSKEHSPIPYFYQNLKEAELVVSTYMYMRLLGYKAEQIAILCAYNGQKALIEDVVKQKCSWDPKIKSPKFITTIDKFQGRQADFVLVSLVRTDRPGHLRDPRRILVALSRARLGLYIFGSWNIFSNIHQLKNFSAQLARYPRDLELVPDERFDTGRLVEQTHKMKVLKVTNLQDINNIINKMKN